MKYLKILALTLITSSCASLLYKVTFNKEIELQQITEGHKSVVFFPMVHVGYPSFYQDVSHKVDSLKKLNYLFLYESTHEDPMDSVTRDFYYRKLRKIFGMNPKIALEERIDTANNTFLGIIQLPKDARMMLQPHYADLDVDMNTAIRTDIPLNRLVGDFEKEYGTIRLSHCDSVTPLGNDSIYNPYDPCKPLPMKLRIAFTNEFILDKRNQHLAKAIEETDSTRIVVIYGEKHVPDVIKLLKENNPAWKVVK